MTYGVGAKGRIHIDEIDPMYVFIGLNKLVFTELYTDGYFRFYMIEFVRFNCIFYFIKFDYLSVKMNNSIVELYNRQFCLDKQ